jgi:hypothetical protein
MVLPPIEKTKFTEGFPSGLKICVTGAGGFIGSHLSRRLKAEGHFVRAVDWKENEYMKEAEFCNEFLNLDLRFPDACKKAVEGMDWCFNLAVSGGASPELRTPPRLAPRLPWRSFASLLLCHRRTWVGWASSSPTTLASCTTRR